MSELRKAALTYAKRGMPVFPVNAEKKPLTPNGFKDATIDERQILAWWKSNPDAGIAIPTGKTTGVTVIDIDPRHDGDKTLENWNTESADVGHATITGSGGIHLWYKYDSRFKTTSTDVGIDCRNDGGYVVVPPSPHFSGGVYKGVLKSPNELTTIPEWLAARFLELQTEQRTTSTAIDSEPIGEGKRNTTLFIIACSLRAQGWEGDEILAHLKKVNDKRCVPPVELSELETIAAHVVKEYNKGVSVPAVKIEAEKKLMESLRNLKLSWENNRPILNWNPEVWSFDDIVDLFARLVPKDEFTRPELKTLLILLTQTYIYKVLGPEQIVFLGFLGPPSSWKSMMAKMAAVVSDGIFLEGATSTSIYEVSRINGEPKFIFADELDVMAKKDEDIVAVFRRSNSYDAKRSLKVPDGEGGWVTTFEMFGGPKGYTAYQDVDFALGTRTYSKVFARKYDPDALQLALSGMPELCAIRDWLRLRAEKQVALWSAEKSFLFMRSTEMKNFLAETKTKLFDEKEEVIPRTMAMFAHLKLFGTILGIDIADCIDSSIEAKKKGEVSLHRELLMEQIQKISDYYRELVKEIPTGKDYKVLDDGRIIVRTTTFVERINEWIRKAFGYQSVIALRDVNTLISEMGMTREKWNHRDDFRKLSVVIINV